MPVTMVCCAGEGVKVPPLELTIEVAGVLAQTHSGEPTLNLKDERKVYRGGMDIDRSMSGVVRLVTGVAKGGEAVYVVSVMES
jgi:hypothetical protein